MQNVFGIYMSAIKRWKKQLKEIGILESQYLETHAGRIDIEK